MRILHLISQRPELTGSGMYIQAVMREAKKNGHENALVAGIPGGIEPPLPGGVDGNRCHFLAFDGEAVPFPVVGMSDVMPYTSRRFSELTPQDVALYEAAFSDLLTRAVKAFSPDIIHSHHLWLLSALARRLFPHIPMVTSCHGTDLRQFETSPHLARRVAGPCRKMDGVLALTHTQALQIEAIYGIPQSKIHGVGGGYDEHLFSLGRKACVPPVEILYAGKLSRAKGVLWLLRSLSRILDLPWRLHVAGSGTGKEEEAFHALAAGLGDRVVVHGLLPHASLAVLMKKAHLFVLPSFFEGLPLVLLEALASGCRLLTTALPGVTELLGETPSALATLVDLPPLETVDQPRPCDEGPLEERLAVALRDQILGIMASPDFDVALAHRVLAPYTWGGVFQRIEAGYGRAIGGMGRMGRMGR